MVNDRSRNASGDGFAHFVKLAKLIQFVAQAVSQGAFGPQLIKQHLGLAEGFRGDFGFDEQLTPATRDFLFSKQCGTFLPLRR